MSFSMNRLPFLSMASNQKNAPVIMGYGIRTRKSVATRRAQPNSEEIQTKVNPSNVIPMGAVRKPNSRYHVRRERPLIKVNNSDIPMSMNIRPNSRYHVRRDRSVVQSESISQTQYRQRPRDKSESTVQRTPQRTPQRVVMKHPSNCPVDLSQVMMDFSVYLNKNNIDQLNMCRIFYLFSKNLNVKFDEFFTVVIYVTLMIIDQYGCDPTEWVRTLESYGWPYIKISEETRLSIDKFLNDRNDDGYKNTEEILMPNGTTFIDLSSPTDVSTFNSSWKWTPSHLNGDVQKFFAPHWANVRPVLDTENFIADVIAMYPNRYQRKKEILKVLSRSQKLSSSDKASAQLVENGICIPALCIILAGVTAQSKRMCIEEQIEIFQKISTGLFQSSIECWRVKKDVMACRPIQQVRNIAANLDCEHYDETPIKGSMWKPYRRDIKSWSSPEYVSETATFMGFFGKFMSDYLNTSILENIKIPRKYVEMISPVLKKNISQRLNNLTISLDPNTYNQDVGIVSIPHTTWDKLCKWISNSDLYSGIATPSSIQGGLILGQKISDLV
jgi:hypothetical protein